MPAVNFYLKKGEGNHPRSLVYMQMRYQGKKFVYNCKFYVEKSNWNFDKQRVKQRSKTDKTGEVNLNDLLQGLHDVCINAYNTELAKNGIPTNAALKPYLDAYLNRSTNKEYQQQTGPTLFKLIDSFISGETGGKKSDGTITTYRNAKKHLLAFEEKEKYPVDFSTITLAFYYKYTSYLSKRAKLSTKSVAKEIKNVRTFMNGAADLGYTTNLAFKNNKFAVKVPETDAVYLTEKELRTLYQFDFRKDKKLEQVRDFFIFSSFVGLRYSDAGNIKPENIVKIDGDDYIKITPQKTGGPVIIPCNDIVLAIFKKYKHNKNRLPPAISNQKFNEYLKHVCKVAKLTETGRLPSDLPRPLYACISSHTARRNFCTNLYLDGVDASTIMRISGHRTEKSFKRYIKVSRVESAKNLNGHLKKGLSKKMSGQLVKYNP